jgi:hypothetical protein
MYKYLATIILIILFLSACSSSSSNHGTHNNYDDQQQNLPNNTPIVEGVDPQETVGEVINLIKNKDFPRLAAYVHPTEGVRFSPYGHVNVDTDVVIQATKLQHANEDDSIVEWGSYDGSGEPIQLNFADYYDKFIYSEDFVNADQVGYNTTIGEGNTINNATDVYPNSYIAEYYFEGTEANNHMDWSSLKIVLVAIERDWVVVGIIHDQWTI